MTVWSVGILVHGLKHMTFQLNFTRQKSMKIVNHENHNFSFWLFCHSLLTCWLTTDHRKVCFLDYMCNTENKLNTELVMVACSLLKVDVHEVQQISAQYKEFLYLLLCFYVFLVEIKLLFFK